MLFLAVCLSEVVLAARPVISVVDKPTSTAGESQYQPQILPQTGGNLASTAIDSVTVFARTRHNASSRKVCLKTHGIVYEELVRRPSEPSVWTTLSHTWDKNPYTSSVWTWDEINTMEIGVALSGSTASPDWAQCTQVYAEVAYITDGLLCSISLRPIGDGSEISIDKPSPPHWNRVSDVSPDDTGSYIENKSGAKGVFQRNLFEISDPNAQNEPGAIVELRGAASSSPAGPATPPVPSAIPIPEPERELVPDWALLIGIILGGAVLVSVIVLLIKMD